MSFTCKLELLLYSMMFFLYIMIVFQIGWWGGWSFYIRFGLVFAFVTVTIITYISISHLPFMLMDIGEILPQIILDIIIISFLIYYNLSIYLTRSFHEKAVKMTFPFKGGVYFAVDGGSSALTNHHITGKYFVENKINESMAYAVDIQKVSCIGRDSKVFFPKKVEDYGIYGETVYCPCDGVVMEVENNVDDNLLGITNTKEPKGNYLIIIHKDIYVALLHFKKGSIGVKEGEIVKKGQPLGKIGNSGLLLAPNLHIQASVGSPWFGEGIPILFDGKFLVRNSLIYKK